MGAGNRTKMKIQDMVDILSGLSGTTKQASDLVSSVGNGTASLPSDLENCDKNTDEILSKAEPLLGEAPAAVKDMDFGFDELKDNVDAAITTLDKFISDVQGELG